MPFAVSLWHKGAFRFLLLVDQLEKEPADQTEVRHRVCLFGGVIMLAMSVFEGEGRRRKNGEKLLPVWCLFVFPLILAKLCYNLKTIFTLRTQRTTFFTSFNINRMTQSGMFLKNA